MGKNPYISQLQELRSDSWQFIEFANEVKQPSINFCDSKNNKNQSHEVQPQEASSGVGVGVVREGRGERLRNSSPLPLPQKKRALNNMGFDADLSAKSRK